MLGNIWNDEQVAHNLKWEHRNEKNSVPDLPFYHTTNSDLTAEKHAWVKLNGVPAELLTEKLRVREVVA